MTAVLAAVGVATLVAGSIVMGTAGTAQASSDEPPGNRVQVPICHKNEGSKGYAAQAPDASSIVSNGHTEHQDGQDIIPPFTWWEKVGNGQDATWEQRDYPGLNTDKLSWIGNSCKPPKPADQYETRDLPGVLDCEADTYTVVHQERRLTSRWDDEAGAWVSEWSQWSTKSKTVTEATDQQCPPPPNPCPNGDYNGAEPGCGTPPPPPPPVTDVCKNIPGDQATVPEGYTEKDGVCTKDQTPPPPPPPPVIDVCDNLPGVQKDVPKGYTEVDGICTKDEVKPAETEKPKPTKAPEPDVVAPDVVAPDEVAGTTEALPTAVAAGLGGPTSTHASTSGLLGQGLVGAGLLMLLLAGALQVGRERGAHQA
jgi:hypothetical protein